MLKTAEFVVLAAALALIGSTVDANAGIRCSGEYQLVNGQEISTPYCQDRHLVKVLAARGIDASAAGLRKSRTYKAQMCQLAAPEPSLLTACAEFAQ